MKSKLLCFVVAIPILAMGFSCTPILTDDEIEDLDLKAIENYVAQNQLSGEYTRENIFVAILDTGIFSIQVDSISQTDTIFVDTFYVDTTFTDTSFVLDTVLLDTQLVEFFIPDTTLFYDNPGSTDTIQVIVDISDLNDQRIFSTNGEIFQRTSGLYPTLGQLLSGFRKGLVEFSAGGRGIILVPSEEAYGRVGNGESLGGNSPIRIDFELVDYYQ